jgi:phosphopantetheinyl transferase (holo-ACP synthase)
MQSTGNDIVSLNAIDVTRTKQPTFYSKILSSTEISLADDPRFAVIPFEIFVWLLWSIKESAFKYLQRIDADVLFTPVKFEVTQFQMPASFKIQAFINEELTGVGFSNIENIRSTISFGDYILHSCSLIYQEFIATVVNSNEDFSKIHWGIKQIDSNETTIQSAEVRKFLIENLTDNNISIGKNPHGIPVILKDNIEQPMLVSLSHHENFIAYSST